jgi:hypothetical protein
MAGWFAQDSLKIKSSFSRIFSRISSSEAFDSGTMLFEEEEDQRLLKQY